MDADVPNEEMEGHYHSPLSQNPNAVVLKHTPTPASAAIPTPSQLPPPGIREVTESSQGDDLNNEDEEKGGLPPPHSQEAAK